MGNEIKVFDGTDLLSVTKSLSLVLDISPEKLSDLVNEYLICNMPNLKSSNLSLQHFCEYYKDSNIFTNTPPFYFDKVIFFHKTSFIDNGVFLREKGLLDLDRLLIISSPLSEYLKQRGVEFFFENEIPFINVKGKTILLKDLPCARIESSKTRIIARLTKSISIPLEGISGFLFLQDAKDDYTYQRINHIPEFLKDLNDCINGIGDDWQKTSKQAILKCEVDIETWSRPGDLYEQENKFEKSNELAEQGFVFLVEEYGKQYFSHICFRSSDYYPFLVHGTIVQPNQIVRF